MPTPAPDEVTRPLLPYRRERSESNDIHNHRRPR
jgi:hypothetical protein